MPHSRLHHLDATAIAILLACCLFWGFQQVLAKATVAEVAPVFQAFVRFAMATMAVLAWCLWRGVRLGSAHEPRGAMVAGRCLRVSSPASTSACSTPRLQACSGINFKQN